MQDTQIQRRCVFCAAEISNKNASREDVVPVWLQRRLDLVDEQITPSVTSPEGELLDIRSHPIKSLKAGRICRNCNNGWMSQLEQSVRPVLEQFFTGDLGVNELNQTQRWILARWATKTAYSLDVAIQESRVPDEHPRFLFEDARRLPPRVAVFATLHANDRGFYFGANRWWKHVPISEDAHNRVKEESYKFSLQFDVLILVVSYWPLIGWNYMIEKDHLHPLWPATLQPKRYIHPSPMLGTSSTDLCLRYGVSTSTYPTKKAEGVV